MFFYLNVDDLANQLRGKTLLDIVQLLGPFEEVFHKLLSLGKIVKELLPASSASCERSFSAPGLIKNHLRRTMAHERLNHLDVMVR